jgi:hypothetical protein
MVHPHAYEEHISPSSLAHGVLGHPRACGEHFMDDDNEEAITVRPRACGEHLTSFQLSPT